MANGPWSVDDHLLLLTSWSDNFMGESMSFVKMNFWIQVTGLPMEWYSSRIGYPFTWHQGNLDRGEIAERLDRFCASQSWGQLFPNTKVWHLSFYSSDHTRILLESSIKSIPVSKRHLKHFEKWWLEEQDIFMVITKFWHQRVANNGI